MSDDDLQYDKMIQQALRGVMAQAIESVVHNGLPGEHHFLIVFCTEYPGVEISQALLHRFPHEMTIVLQHQFWDLKTGPTGFEVSLSFSNVMEHMRIPYAAVKAFSDPSVKFGLQFHVEDSTRTLGDQDAEIHALDDTVKNGKPSSSATHPETEVEEGAEAKEDVSGDVVSLDAFRKK